jgi:hypothetical protein
LLENATERSSDDALADIAARSGKHEWMQTLHNQLILRLLSSA